MSFLKSLIVKQNLPRGRFDIGLLEQCLHLAGADAVFVVDQQLDVTRRESVLDRTNNLTRRKMESGWMC